MMLISDLTEQQLLALAIANEEEDSRIYKSFSAHLKADYPSSALIFDKMAEEEVDHRTMLYKLYQEKFGDFLPLIRRQDVKDFMVRKPTWLRKSLSLETIREEAASMEREAANYYRKASAQCRDIGIRKLLIELAEIEEGHENTAHELQLSQSDHQREAETQHKKFVLTYVQPGLAGLMDGSVSTLAPLFAAAFATQSLSETFIVGLAASGGAGISMGLTEGLSDDGVISGRGSPLIRGIVTGFMTLLGGLGHTLPYLIPASTPNAFAVATTIAIFVVLVELVAIAWIRWKYMETSFVKAAIQIILGGLLVVGVGVWLGKM